MLQGKMIRLRAPERSDIPAFVRWFNDIEVTRFLLRNPPMGMEEEEAWFDSLVHREGRVFCIETLEGKLIGNLGIMKVDWTDRKADLGVIIGEKDFWSKGYGTEAISLILAYMFEEMNLNRVWLYCDEANLRAQRCYEKCGFAKEGMFRANRFKDGIYINDVVMSVLRAEWLRHRSGEG